MGASESQPVVDQADVDAAKLEERQDTRPSQQRDFDNTPNMIDSFFSPALASAIGFTRRESVQQDERKRDKALRSLHDVVAAERRRSSETRKSIRAGTLRSLDDAVQRAETIPEDVSQRQWAPAAARGGSPAATRSDVGRRPSTTTVLDAHRLTPIESGTSLATDATDTSKTDVISGTFSAAKRVAKKTARGCGAVCEQLPDYTKRTTIGCCNSCCFLLPYIVAVFCGWAAFWNSTKLPYTLGEEPYTNVTWNATVCDVAEPPMYVGLEASYGVSGPYRASPCHGQEISVNMAWWNGYRSPKIISSPKNFVSPHIAMAVGLELILVSVLVQGKSTMVRRSFAFVPLTVAFVLHIYPVSNGLPTRQNGRASNVNESWVPGEPGMGHGAFDVNVFVCTMLLLFSAVATVAVALQIDNLFWPVPERIHPQAFFVKLTGKPAAWCDWLGHKVLFVCWVAMGFLINGGAFAEWNLMRSAVNARKTVTPYAWPIPEGNKPHPLSGHGPYYQYPGEVGVAFTVIFFIATGIFMLYEWGILGLFLQYFKYIRKHGFLMASGWLFSRMVPVPGHIGELERAARISDPRAGTALVRLKNKLVKAAATHQRMKYILRIGCLTRDGPALWQLLRHPTVFGRGGYVAPERYLEGAGEMFILMIIVCWMITLRYSPEIIEKNGLKDIIGYDNLCVGFDAPPARYVAVPMQVMMAVLACRYSSLDTTRAALEFTHGNITRSQYWCSYIANTVYAGFLCCFPMLLVLTPDLSSGIRDIHTYDCCAILAQFWRNSAQLF